MKKVLLGLAAVCLTFACASQQKSAVGPAESAPKAECGAECEKACCEGAKTECSGEQKTCPATGKPIS